MSDLYRPDEAQMRFLDLIYEEGRIDATLLDVPLAVQDKIEAFPALRWKAHNVANHVARNAPGPRL